jgi:hypothetical protein
MECIQTGRTIIWSVYKPGGQLYGVCTNWEDNYMECVQTGRTIIWSVYKLGGQLQHNVLFVCSLLSYHTATCFGHISSPSSGGRMYICGKWYCYTAELTVSGPGLPPVSASCRLLMVL